MRGKIWGKGELFMNEGKGKSWSRHFWRYEHEIPSSNGRKKEENAFLLRSTMYTHIRKYDAKANTCVDVTAHSRARFISTSHKEIGSFYYHTIHFSLGFILLPIGHLKSLANKWLLLATPLMRNCMGACAEDFNFRAMALDVTWGSESYKITKVKVKVRNLGAKSMGMIDPKHLQT